MIASALPSTALARTTPSLLLDFTLGALDSRVTFTRSGAASRVNASGLIESVAADAPRFDYDPVTLACRGLLIEETRQNVVTNSTDLAQASWNTYVSGAGTIGRTQNAGTAPDGANTATKLDFYAASGDQSFVFSNTFNVTVGQVFSGSFYAKAATGADVGKQIIFRHAGSAAFSVATLTSNWVRYSSTETGPVTYAPELMIGLRPDVAGGSGAVSALIWGGQIELGAFATSYIPTTSAAATRGAELAVIDGATFTGLFNPTAGTLLVEGRAGAATNAALVSLDDNTTNNRLQLRRNTANTLGNFRMALAGGSIDVNVASNNADGFNKHVASFKVGEQSYAVNTQLATGITPVASLPAVTQMNIGNGAGSSSLNGHVKQIAYWSKALTAADLQVLSSAAGQRSMIRSLINPVL
jgi:hypothetical protein